MKKWWSVLLSVFVLLGCQRVNQVFSEKKVTIGNKEIDLPMRVSELIELTETDLMVKEGATLKAGDYTVVTLNGFQIGIYNETEKELPLEECSVLGFTQSLKQVDQGADIVQFPEKLEVGMAMTSQELSDLLMEQGGICVEHVGITENDESETVIGGEGWIDLSQEWIGISETVIYPIQIVLEDGIITRIQMIFIDQAN